MVKKIITVSAIMIGIPLAASILMFLAYSWVTSGERQEILKDEYNNRKLIEYWDMDTNELRLELVEGKKRSWIRHPECCIKYEGRISDNTIKFDRSTSSMLIVNGNAFKIEEEK